ncbi:MAG TPA: YiiD C-terminal domain-containing protein [Gammaproteobacteria bacterium]|nr:YiiD C-terminal domain-containing protein [Gammaproteobacteria bacterium]
MMNPAVPHNNPAARLEYYLHENIPLVQHMQIQVVSYDQQALVLSAPLAANINHKLTAFGGSIAALATLTCWGVLWLMLEPRPDLHIVVHESHIRYLRPVTDTLVAKCTPPDDSVRRHFMDTLQRRRKARLELSAQIVQRETVCAVLTGNFVAFQDAAG